MITEFFIDIIFSLLSGMLSALPEITWSVDTSAFTFISDIFRVVGYLFPVQTVSSIISLIFGLTVFRILISIPKAIWDLFPLV